jgi:AraC-like DNA-binding protein
MEIIAWIGFSQALFSGLLTLTKGNKSISDRLLTAWLFLFAIEFLTFGLESKIFPNFILLTNSFLLFNPALYLYTCSLAKPNFKLRRIQLLHLAPYLFFKITSWIIGEPQSFETFFQADKTLWFRLLFGIFGIISWVIYLALTGIVLTKHRKHIQNEFSTIDTFKKIGWILFIVVIYILYCFSAFIWGMFNIIIFNTLSLTIYNYSVLLFFIYIFGFYGLKQTEIFKRTPHENGTIKPQVSILNETASENIKTKILNYFQKEKPYLNPDLNMTLLSEKLKVPKHHLTEVLNGKLGKNFFQFVNEYRVEEVKKQLANPKNPYSIEAIGFECGFNSKSTFFSVFKNITGQTPMEYKVANNKFQITNSK